MKKILIFEQFDGGHHTNFIEALLPEFANLVRKNLVNEVVVTITNRHFQIIQNRDVFKETSTYIKFDTLLPEINPNPSFKDRQKITTNIVDAIERNQPDYLVSTSADYESLFLAIRNLLKRKALPKNLFSLGIFHYGYSGSISSFSDYVKQATYSFSWRNAGWSRLLMINPVVYESLLQEDQSFQGKTGLVPDPVPQSVYFDKEAARRILGIPETGRYVGFVGAMDTRKAIPELVTAWANVQSGANDYLLLAGRLEPFYKQLIESQFPELVEQGRIICLNKYLSYQELIAGYCALDLVAILQYKRPNLSENLLKSIAVKKPVIVDDYGYTGMLTKRFQAGHTCNINDQQDLEAKLRIALAESGNYTISQGAERLMAFHQPSNFVNTILHNLDGLLPQEYTSELKTWEWVCGSQH